MVIDLSKMHSGFCDRLRLITFVVALSRLKYKKNFIKIYEKKSKECPYLFKSLCDVKNFNIKKINKISKKDLNITMNPYNSSLNKNNVEKLNPFKELETKALYNEWRKSYKLIEPKTNIKKNFS